MYMQVDGIRKAEVKIIVLEGSKGWRHDSGLSVAQPESGREGSFQKNIMHDKLYIVVIQFHLLHE